QLKVTRSMIRSLPRRKVPRSFTLTPDMVPAPRKNVWLPVFSYASAVSAVIAVVLLLVQFLPGGMLGKPAQSANELAMSAEMDTFTAQSAADEPQVIYWGGLAPQVYAEGKGGGGGDGSPIFTQSEPSYLSAVPFDQSSAAAQDAFRDENPPEAAAEAASGAIPAEPVPLEPTPLPETVMAAPQSTEAPRQQQSPATEESAPQAAPEAEAQAYGSTTQNNGPILGVKPNDQANQMTIPQSSIPPVVSETAPASALPGWITYTFIGLAALSGAAALYLWRKT
ncbi:MAG: hypothetical protein AAGU05_05870, partial [Anaerolineaceae bacterium]